MDTVAADPATKSRLEQPLRIVDLPDPLMPVTTTETCMLRTCRIVLRADRDSL